MKRENLFKIAPTSFTLVVQNEENEKDPEKINVFFL